jgi:GAF domain-containing protein
MIRNDLEFLRLDAALEAVAAARAQRAEARAARVEVRQTATDTRRGDRRETREDLTYEEAVRRLEEHTREHEASVARLAETRRLLQSVRSLMTAETMTPGEAPASAGSGTASNRLTRTAA